MRSPAAKIMSNPVGETRNNNVAAPYVQDGKPQYNLKLIFDPKNNKEHAKFIAEINDLEAEATSNKGATYPVVKPRYMKDKESDKFIEHETEVTIVFKSKDAPVVLDESDRMLRGSDRALSRGTEVEIEFDVKSYDFTTNEGKHVMGVRLEMKEIQVTSSPDTTRREVFRR